MNKKILVIDDNRDYSEAIQAILEGAAYSVTTANSSDEGIQRLEVEAPDLIILDIVMQKGAEGVLLARRIKKDPRWGRIPILMLTSITQQTGFRFVEDDPRDPKYLPVDDFAEKPIPVRVLLEKVGRLISIREAVPSREDEGSVGRGQGQAAAGATDGSSATMREGGS